MLNPSDNTPGPELALDIATPARREASPSTIVPQFAIDAANVQVARVSGALTQTADTIDQLLLESASALPEPVLGMVRTASGKLRDLADGTGEQDAAVLLGRLEQAAARNVAITVGVGTAIGAALGLAFTRAARVGASRHGTLDTAASA